jgi:hypothetical protein
LFAFQRSGKVRCIEQLLDSLGFICIGCHLRAPVLENGRHHTSDTLLPLLSAARPPVRIRGPSVAELQDYCEMQALPVVIQFDFSVALHDNLGRDAPDGPNPAPPERAL